MDTYDHLVPDDLKQAATIVASFVYNTAQRDQKIPRKAMPQAQVQGNRAFSEIYQKCTYEVSGYSSHFFITQFLCIATRPFINKPYLCILLFC